MGKGAFRRGTSWGEFFFHGSVKEKRTRRCRRVQIKDAAKSRKNAAPRKGRSVARGGILILHSRSSSKKEAGE